MNKVVAKIWHSKYVQFFVSDKLYLTLYFRKRFGYNINWKNPETFNEKIQWLKLYDRKDEYTQLVDKLRVREFIKDKVGEKYLVKLLGVYNSVEEIDYDELPKQFVLKTTHDSGGVVICKDKDIFNIEKANQKLNRSMKDNYYWLWREWPYKNVEHKIICEEYLVDDVKNEEIADYKVLCFNSEPKIIQVCEGRQKKGGVKFGFYDTRWKELDVKRAKHNNLEHSVSKPNVLEEMLEVSRKLSKGLKFIRVDFYIVNDRLYCGELTFYPGSGFEGFEPEEYDKIMGDWIDL